MHLRKLKRYPFTRVLVEYAPEDRGVYVLWHDVEVLFIGKTARSLKAVLSEHLAGARGDCTRAATHYSWEITPFDSLRESELLTDYLVEREALPRCQRLAKPLG